MLLLFVGVGAVVTVLPLLHLCGVAFLVVAAPVATWLGWRASIVTSEQQYVACPRCTAAVLVEAGRRGWPLRFQCQNCGVGFTARAAD
jgi:DNA-directed RNA polymerase subunit RPC12/RpoP